MSSCTPSRTVLASADHVRGGGVAAVGQRQRMLGRQPGRRAVAGIALAEAGALHQPARRQLHPVRGRDSCGTGPSTAACSRSNSVGRDHRVGEERPDAPGVVVGLVEHHALAGPQRQHRRRAPAPGRRADPARRPARRPVRRSAAARCARRRRARTPPRARPRPRSVLRMLCGNRIRGRPAAPSGPRRCGGRAAGPGVMVSATSAPYAPTFCTGVAPADPGMPDRHSSPPSPCASDGRPRRRPTPHRPRRAATLPSTVIVGVGEPHDGQVGQVVGEHHVGSAGRAPGRVGGLRSRARSAATICSVVVQVITRRATGPTRSVVSGASGTSSATAAPAECADRPRAVTVAWPAMPRSFDMAAEYEGSVEQVHQRIQRRAVLAGAAGRLRRRRRHAGLDDGRTPTAASTS